MWVWERYTGRRPHGQKHTQAETHTSGSQGPSLAHSNTSLQLTLLKKAASMISLGGFSSAPKRNTGSRHSRPVSSVFASGLNFSSGVNSRSAKSTRWYVCRRSVPRKAGVPDIIS